MYQVGAAQRQIVPFIFITLLVLGGWSRTQAQVVRTCSEFATAHCGGSPVMLDTVVAGGTASPTSCTVNVDAGLFLKFKNLGNPDPCLGVGGALIIQGAAGSSLRIEHTTINAGSIDINSFGSLTKVEDSTLSSDTSIAIASDSTGASVTVEDSALTATDITIESQGANSPVLVKDTVGTLDLQATGSILIQSSGAGSSVNVKGGTLTADAITMTTAAGSLLAVAGAELTANVTEIGSDGGAGDAVDNIKANTFGGGDFVTIRCPARVTSNTFLSGNLSITGSSPCTCSKNTPNVVCPFSGPLP